MESKRWKILFLILLVLAILSLISIDLHGKILETRAIVVNVSIPTPLPTPSWTLLGKILEEDKELEGIELKIGTTEILYTEERINRDSNGKISRSKIQRKDFEKEIALKLLDIETGKTEIIKITKKGSELVNPPGYQIAIVQRPSGITWNAWNTFYRVNEPVNKIVIKNKYPNVKSTKIVARKRVPNIIEYITYVPYSDDLKTTEIIAKGRENIKDVVSSARNLLNERLVYSKAFPDKLITEVLPEEYYLRRPIIEQSDLGEFILDPHGTVERFLVILGANGGKAWSETCNKSGACGLYQFTDNGVSGTYRTVAKRYPAAQLIKNFEEGASNQVNSAIAAMLLDDLNLAELVRRYKGKIINDPKLEEYLAAAYNGAPRWVHQSLNATLGKNIEWGRYLRPETKGFMVKLRYLITNKLP